MSTVLIFSLKFWSRNTNFLTNVHGILYFNIRSVERRSSFNLLSSQLTHHVKNFMSIFTTSTLNIELCFHDSFYLYFRIFLFIFIWKPEKSRGGVWIVVAFAPRVGQLPEKKLPQKIFKTNAPFILYNKFYFITYIPVVAQTVCWGCVFPGPQHRSIVYTFLIDYVLNHCSVILSKWREVKLWYEEIKCFSWPRASSPLCMYKS